jgi:sugar phosphate isomerase/epimerase
MIFVSTTAFPYLTAVQCAELLGDGGIRALELSGGGYSPGLYKELLDISRQMTLQLHNYFPPSEKPFVFNLASLDDEIAALSLNHVRTALRWAIDFGRPVYSFHAGYLVDPTPGELGNKISKRRLFNRLECLKHFIDRVNVLADFAAQEGASLLIENNVLSQENLIEFGNDPLLMTTPQETAFVLQQTPDTVGLLVDVGHLKVSSNVLGFDPLEMLASCNSWIRGYHFSDNDGFHDDNDPVRSDSWFWDHVKTGLDYYSLEVHTTNLEFLKEQVVLVDSMIERLKEA